MDKIEKWYRRKKKFRFYTIVMIIITALAWIIYFQQKPKYFESILFILFAITAFCYIASRFSEWREEKLKAKEIYKKEE